jgi:hypothetical protein
MNRFAHCTFCDDIRHEVGNKTSYMGIYGALLGVPTFPHVLPKFCIAAVCTTPIDMPFKTISVRIAKNGNVVNEGAIPEDQLKQMHDVATSQSFGDDPAAQIHFGFQTVISPFLIDEKALLTVTIIADGVDYIAGKLRISDGTPDPLTPSSP